MVKKFADLLVASGICVVLGAILTGFVSGDDKIPFARFVIGYMLVTVFGGICLHLVCSVVYRELRYRRRQAQRRHR